MDEGLLNDLLECSVCLERLDTSSRVLPCQHTFCLKCLKVIVESHKELRCPECRVLVEAKVEELPPNVLLMRILEGMKNSVPRKPVAAQRGLRSAHSQQAQQAAQTRDGKQLPPHARAMHDYLSKEMGDLSFKKGETILLLKKLDPYWYQGECSGRSGIFPINYVQVVVPLQVPTALCKALYDFRMSAPDEEGCLAFDKGAIITVHRRVDENWAEGRIEQKVGIFPIAFVELNQAARMLMSRTPLNRPVPPIPDHAKAGHSDHRHRAAQQHLHRYQPMSTSMPTTNQSNYQNMATMSQSHPNYQPDAVPPVSQQVAVSHGVITAAPLQRTIVEPAQTKHSLDLIHFTSKGTIALQSVPRINENCERIRGVKFEYNSSPVQKVETTYQNVRTHEHFPVSTANFSTNISSDSSSSMNTPSIGSTTTPNTSSNTSTCESAEPSLPSSPDNNTERNATVITGNTTQNPPEETNEQENSLDTSMGVLSLNESSTATNTSLNVSLPPAESPKLNANAAGNTTQDQEEVQESTSNSEPSRLELPSSSKGRPSGPESLLDFGLGLRAALSPAHDTRPRESRDKRHSLTTAHQHTHTNQNRHSAEIVATSLLDHGAGAGECARGERRRRRERSAERPLPAAYVAVYPYKPQKPDELELRKGAVYTVSERCRDGWFKGWCARSQRHGVFPGNYVAWRANTHARHHRDKTTAVATPAVTAKPATTATATATAIATSTTLAPPDAPPRAQSPTNAYPLLYSWAAQRQVQALSQQSTPRMEKSKDKSKAEKSSISTGVSLMKRLAAMKKCKSPPPQGYSMDNPVFEDGPGTSLMLNLAHHPVHVRSGSCPSQLLRALPASASASAPAPAPASDRRHKERHDHLTHRSSDGAWQSQHRKSQSLDVTAVRRDRHHSQSVKERFRCIVPYPPNSEYELELKVDDIVIVSKKRGDGWYKGTLQRTGRTGLFPASFVQSCPQE